MEVKVIASGSKGNITLIMCKDMYFLIDVGITYHDFLQRVEPLHIDLTKIKYILITHTHKDHIKGLVSFVKKLSCKILVTEDNQREIGEIINKNQIETLTDKFTLGDVEGELLHISHDAIDPVGFLLVYQEKSLVYITDTGYINRKYLKKIQNKNMYIIESNHDEKMLMEGPYPYYLKQRVISDIGHLSNHAAAKYLSAIIGSATEYVVLAHLSETNNKEELALEAVIEEFKSKEIPLPKIYIATQLEGSELIEV